MKRQAQDVMAEKANEVVANVEERARQTGDRVVGSSARILCRSLR